jgi:TP901 family phage tail tape measure protein
MNDAISTIALGVDTAPGLAHLKELRAAFAGLRADINEFNALRSNPQALTGDSGKVKNELATLSAALKEAQGEIAQMQVQMQSMAKANVSAAEASSKAVVKAVQDQNRGVIESEKAAAAETQKLAKETTKVVEDEARKRYTMSQSAKVGSVTYGFRQAVPEDKAQTQIINNMLAAQRQYMASREGIERQAEATHRQIMFDSAMRDQTVLDDMLAARKARLEKQAMDEALINQRRDVVMATAGAKATQLDGKEAYKQRMAEQRQEYQAHLQKEREYTARHKELEKAINAAQDQEYKLYLIKQSEELRTARLAQNQQYKEHLLKQAEHLKEWKQIEKMIEDDEKDAKRRKLKAQDQEYQEHLMRQAEYSRRHKELEEVFRKADKEAETLKLKAQEQEYKEHLLRQQGALAKYNAEQRQTILNNNFNSGSLGQQVNTTRRAAGMVNIGQGDLAKQLYGSDAVGAISRLAQMEDELARGIRRTSAARQEAAGHMRENTRLMNDAHSAARGLAGGLGQLWLTWGNTVPLVAGAALTGSMVKTLATGKEVEYQLQFLRALADENNRSPLDMEKFLTVTDGTMATLKDAAGGMRALSQAGMNQQEAFKSLPDILNLAAMGEMSVGAAALSATGVVNAFGMSLNEIGRVGDVFAKIASASNTSVTGMTESMKQASTVGEMFKVGMEETAATIGVLAQRNIYGTSAGTSLTNALKSLYEPTAHAALALKQLGISTDDGMGGLKDYTQLMDELRIKLSALNDSSKAVMMGTFTDQRGMKTISAITQNYDKYLEFLKKAKESQDFMGEGTLQLEDTVQGAWQRMNNSLDGSFQRAFTNVQPALRGVIKEMGELAKSDSVVDLLTRIASTGVSVVEMFANHSKAITIAVAAYAGLRIINALNSQYILWKTTTAAATAATAANTVATTANAGALVAQSAAARVATGALGLLTGAARIASVSFGPLAAIAMTAYTAYELLTSSVDKNENTLRRSSNTVDTMIDFYDRQIKKLRELNAEFLENNRLAKQGAGETAKAVLNAERQSQASKVSKLERELAAAGNGPSQAALVGATVIGGPAGRSKEQIQTELDEARRELRKYSNELLDLENKEIEYRANRGLNKKLNDKDKVRRDINSMIVDAGGVPEGSDLKQGGTEASRKLIPELEAMLKELDTNSNSYKKLYEELPKWRDKINAAKGSMSLVKPGAGNDAYRAQQAGLDGDLQRIRDEEKSKLADIKTRLNTGEIGQLQAIAQSQAVVTAARNDEVKVFEKKEALAAKQEKRARDQQVMDNKQAEATRAILEADKDANRQRSELSAKWNEESLRSVADRLRKEGDLVGAFREEFKGKYGTELVQLSKDENDTTLTQGQRDSATKRKSFLKGQETAGEQSATFEQLAAKYEEVVSTMENRLAEAAQKASNTNGFFSDVGAAVATDSILAEMIPKAEELRQQMAGVAESLNDPKLRSNVSRMGTELVKDAQRSTKAWVDAGKSIEKSLTDAFGKGGKAVGGIISALIRQKAEQKDIDDQLKKAQSDPKMDRTKLLEIQDAATEKSTQLQLSSYGSIASAAKGFFDEKSKGYAVMQAAEQTFRAFELASAIHTHVVKSGLLTSFLALFTTTKGGEVAANAATLPGHAAVEGTKQTMFGMTALAGALALPFPANLPAFAIVAAMLASIGVAIGGAGGGGGGSGMSLSAGRQKYQGTGFQYDATNPENNPYEWELQKSESLSKSIDALRENSAIELRYSSSQLLALESINAGISGLANTVSITSGIRGTRADEKALGVYDTHSKLGFSSSSTSLLDSGIRFNNTDIGTILNGGGVAQSYAELEKKKKSWWGLSSSKSTSVVTQNLDGSIADQMKLMVADMFSVVSDAAASFGKDVNSVETALKSLNLSAAGLTQISLKGLSADEVEKELQAVFGRLGDTMAKFVLPGMEAYQQAGEGYFTTTVRVSSGIEAANYTMQKLGIAAVKYTDVLNKQGDISMEIVRASLMYKESTGGILSGIGEMVKTFNGSAAELAESYTKLNDVRRTMLATGAKNANVTSDMVKGAGGVDNLSSGMSAFLENFFTDGERAAIKAEMLGDSFKKLGVSLPSSKDSFKKLVEGIDRTTPAGQELYGALLNLASQFSDMADDMGNVNPKLAKQRAAVMSLVDTANRWLDVARTGRDLLRDIDAELNKNSKGGNDARIAELRKLMSSDTTSFEQQLELAGEIKDLVLQKYEIEKENAEKLIEFGGKLQDYVKDLRTGDKSPLTNGEKLAEAKKLYDQTLTDLGSSDEKVRDKARDSIQERADTLLELAKTYYSSSQSYRDIFNAVTEQLDTVGADAVGTGTTMEEVAKDQLIELKDLRTKVGDIVHIVEDELNTVTVQLATQLRIMDEMSRDLGVISEVPSILRSLPAELAAQMNLKGAVSGVNVNSTVADGVRQLYLTMLGRPVEQDGLEFWTKAAANNGATLEQIKKAIEGSDEYKAKQAAANTSIPRGNAYIMSETEVTRTDKAAIASSTASFTADERAEMAKEIADLKTAINNLTEASATNTDRMVNAMYGSTSQAADQTAEAVAEAVSSSKFNERNQVSLS